MLSHFAFMGRPVIDESIQAQGVKLGKDIGFHIPLPASKIGRSGWEHIVTRLVSGICSALTRLLMPTGEVTARQKCIGELILQVRVVERQSLLCGL